MVIKPGVGPRLNLFLRGKMSVITRLDKSAARYSKVRVFLDGRYAFSLEKEIAERLQVNQDLSLAQIEELTRVNQQQRCLAAARRLLANRPHSEKELRQKLTDRKFSDVDIDAVCKHLKSKGILSDADFASFWTENRETFKPKSRNLTALELKRKGVASEIVQDVITRMDDVENAYRAAEKKATRLGINDYSIFRRRLGEYLLRRGFSYEVANRTIERLWREKNM